MRPRRLDPSALCVLPHAPLSRWRRPTRARMPPHLSPDRCPCRMCRDVINGKGGNDILDGGAGNDVINGQDGESLRACALTL